VSPPLPQTHLRVPHPSTSTPSLPLPLPLTKEQQPVGALVDIFVLLQLVIDDLVLPVLLPRFRIFPREAAHILEIQVID